MTRPPYQYAKQCGSVVMITPEKEKILIPIFPGILKHLSIDQLPENLRKYNVAKKYTNEALRIAPWVILSAFPKKWLLKSIKNTSLRAGRKQALMFMLS